MANFLKVYRTYNVIVNFSWYNFICASLIVFILQGYDSIPAEIPDPKAKKVGLFVYCMFR